MSTPLSCLQGHQWARVEGGAGGRALACPTCGAAPTLESLGAPPEVAGAVQRLREELARLAGNNLAGLILYGGLARGRFRPGRSDVNLVILLNDASTKSLAPLASTLRTAWRTARVEPLIITPAEVKGAADAFATKFLDIQGHHVVLSGDDPFAALNIEREHLWLRVEQELRNLSLRLRRRFISIADNPDEMSAALLRIARPLAIELESLLCLKGKPAPAVDSSARVFEAAADAFQLDRDALARLAGLRHDMQLSAQDAPEIYQRVLDSVTRAAHIADQRENAS